jgi:hypothetical protein
MNASFSSNSKHLHFKSFGFDELIGEILLGNTIFKGDGLEEEAACTSEAENDCWEELINGTNEHKYIKKS